MMVTPIQTSTSNPIVDPDFYVSKMEKHWTETLGNASNQPLRDLWRHMCVIFNHQIDNFGKPEGQRLKVLQPPTGKSQGLAVYCSCLTDDNHPGVLIVVRLKEQADDAAKDINKLAGKQVALARHSDTSVTPEELEQAPVAIITHSAYGNGLDAIARGEPNQSAWNLFHKFGSGSRRLVVIDEALDLLEESSVSLKEVRHLRAEVSTATTPEAKAGVQTLDQFIDSYEKLTTTYPDGRERMVSREELTALDPDTLIPLRKLLRSQRLDRSLAHREDRKENARLISIYSETLKAVQEIITHWRIFALNHDQYCLSTGKLILPEDNIGAVILDATAKENVLYSLLPDRVDPPEDLPTNARSYQNVTLNVSMGHSVGKRKLTMGAKEEVANLVQSMLDAGLKDKKVLVCCHQNVEPFILQYRDNFDDLAVTHWGAIDGKNEWSHYDTVVIFGLQYRPNQHTAHLYSATQGPQTTAWLQGEEDRRFGDHADIRHAITVGYMSTNIIQAINRVRCRRVIDGQGNCAPTDVYILLPSDKTGKGILKCIKDHMPNIKQTQWDYQHAKKAPKKSAYREALLSYASGMMPGEKAISEVATDLGLNTHATDFLRRQLRQTDSPFYRKLQDLGVTYRVDGKGRGSRSYLIKEVVG
ncbi:hypothetical protein [Cohaesibacter intestini]|uniref:hypothetical protein n=1 Tax=Cohaesibacter intestini TaxID=2211145 RepID=UPI000DE8627D|nr:hypothetical protein [Cohaesibacter intestini]